MRIATWLHHVPATRATTDQIIEGLSKRGINTLIVAFKNWTGPTFYPSAIAHTEEGFTDGGLYGHVVDACHRAGIECEAWICTFPEAGRSRLIEEHPECRVLRADGTEYRIEGGNGVAWACPANDLTQAYEAALCKEVLERYPKLSGLHLDYIRFPSTEACYCKCCQDGFRRQYGMELVGDRSHGLGPEFDAFVRFRCGHIRRFVEKAHAVSSAAGVRLTAAVFPYYPSIMYDLGQDWADWSRAGIIDALYPMVYNRSDLMVERYTTSMASLLRGTRCSLCTGLGLAPDITADEVRRQARAALDAGSEGLVIFECHQLLALPEDTLAPVTAHGPKR
jgi:uncharacterized lipoprotein YddW (UPF0748 family)